MKLKISFCSVFPEIYQNFLELGIVGRALAASKISCNQYRFADFVSQKKRIDEPICGHGPGMVLAPEVVFQAISKAEEVSGLGYKIFLSPHGKVLNQKGVQALSQKLLQRENPHLILVAGRYEGFDARVEAECADEVISIGDYVLMGGDLPAMVLAEALLRYVPGVIGDIDSVDQDSFSGPLVDYPHYCLPVVWHNREVPPVLFSGNHKKIAAWRNELAFNRTIKHHADWFFQSIVTTAEKQKFLSMIPSHYVVLMHDQVLVGSERKEGRTSVTSLDIHDIARSAKTYGIKGYFIVTSLQDQQAIVKKFLEFWHEGRGVTYNKTRYEAISQVFVASSLDEVVRLIEQKEAKAPLLIATSALAEHKSVIDYHDRYTVWRHQRPVLLLFGTGQGLAPEVITRAEFLLAPLSGLTEYNHLSVRSAAAIIFDRWLGLNTRGNNCL